MSRAIVINSYGSSQVLAYKKQYINEPLANQIQIKNTAIGVNYHDVYVRSGLYKTLALPGIPGCEASGIVEKIGFRSTTIRKIDKSLAIIPNFQFAENAVVNVSETSNWLISWIITLQYDTLSLIHI